MSGIVDNIPDIDFSAKYVPESLDIVKIMRQGADFYKAWDSRTLALEAEHYFNMYVTLSGLWIQWPLTCL